MGMVERIWYLSSECDSIIYRWDAGDEIWELESESMQHYRVISRSFVNESRTEMKEVLEHLPESAVPAEIFTQSYIRDMKWKYVETSACTESDTDTSDSWDWTPLHDCIPSNVLYRSPSPVTVEDSSEWYPKQGDLNSN
jgi:hypothetical protein